MNIKEYDEHCEAALRAIGKDERIGKMLDTIVEAYIRTARETIAEWNGD